MPIQATQRNARYLVSALAALLLALASVTAVQAGCSKSVILYGTSWCPYCKQVKSILARNHIKYTLLDADKASVQAMMRKQFGDTAVPRTVIGGVVVEGVDEERIQQLCGSDDEDGPSPVDIMLPDFPPLPNGVEIRAAAPATPFRG